MQQFLGIGFLDFLDFKQEKRFGADVIASKTDGSVVMEACPT